MPWLPAVIAALVAWQLAVLLSTGERQTGPLTTVAGALAFALAVALGVSAAPLPAALFWDARMVVLAGGLVLVTGLHRDVGRGVPYLAGAGLIAGTMLVVGLTDIGFEAVKVPFRADAHPFWHLGTTAPAAAFAFILAVALVVRATDPLPGLAAGQGAIFAGTFLVVALTRGRDTSAAVSGLCAPLAAAVGGACLGLLLPGRGRPAVTLGRGGAGLLGFLLGVLAVVGTLKNTAFLMVGLPVLALAVPLANVTYMRRQRHRAGGGDPARLDRARTLPDMLLRRGFTHRRSTGLLLALQAYCCLVALVLVGLVTVPVLVKLLLCLLLLPAAFAAFFLVTRIAARVAVTDAGKVDILGAPIDAVTYATAMARVDEFIASRQPHHIFTADVSGIMRAREEPELAEIIRTSDLVTADGAGVLWAARVFDFPLPERVSGVDLVRRMCALAAHKGYRVFLLGAAPGVAEAAAAVLLAENPGLTVAGTRDGYFQDEAEAAESLRQATPDIVFVALGIPRQERFIRRWYGELGLPVCMGVGGSFDVISGRLERAPLWMQRSGLEWLYRVIQEPKRLPRLIALPRFVFAIAWDAWRRWRAG